MNRTYLALALAALTGCTSPERHPERYYQRYEQPRYREGVRAAQRDLQRGVLAYEDIQCEEEEGWRILWCYRKLLADKYGVEYRVIAPSPLPGAIGQSNGYKSVTGPLIAARLGSDWEKRILREAE